jgi:5,5'-dehydrodivanillate O-demethylase
MQTEERVDSKTQAPDFVHTGPGTLAGRYLRRYWQPVFRASDLAPGHAVPIRILGEDLTLYRGQSGIPHVVAARCAHRGTQLSTGWVEGDCVRCRYHGWRYDGSGQCVEQPGEAESFAAKIRIPSYPTEEYLGLVFAYLGEGDPPPLRHFPDFDKPGVFEADPPEAWPCNFFNRLDNDPAHVPWTHRESNRRRGQVVTPEARSGAEYVEAPWGVGSTEPGASRQCYLMPNVNQLRVRVRVPGYQQFWEHRLVFHVPIDDENSVAFDVNLVPGLSGEEGEVFRQRRRDIQEKGTSDPYEAAKAILAGKMRVEDMDPGLSLYKQFWIEDYVTIVGQGAIADRANEHLGRQDVKIIIRRRLWQRELRALAEGRPLTEWTTPAFYEGLPVSG